MEKDYTASFKYFENRECAYYPCHKAEHINCLFCYCPLYHYDCPGNFKMIESKSGKVIKSCIDCQFPHNPDNYDRIMEILSK